jgi:hypothetical protein
MLNRILSEKDCAECRLCCNFYEHEIWEAPIVGDEICYDEKGLYFCPELGENGCKLGNDKPFDCKLWPFRVMKFGEAVVVALSPLCKKVNEKPLSELAEFVHDEEFEEKVKARVSEFPAQVMDYAEGYAVLRVLN